VSPDAIEAVLGSLVCRRDPGASLRVESTDGGFSGRAGS
jgi:hypothetical protein